MTELRRRTLEELQLRNYSPHTQRAYIRCLANFAEHFGTAPDRLARNTSAITSCSWSSRKSSRGRRSTKRYAHYVFSTITSCVESG
jgi:predicted AAA+ superfamily ATPase